MSRKKRNHHHPKAESFAEQAQESQPGIVAEFIYFLLHNKKWWITPIVLVLLAFGALMMMTGNPATAPFIYTLF